jgi:hypothetical protein
VGGSLSNYDTAGGFIAVILREIYGGSARLDEATSLELLALVARFAERSGDPVPSPAEIAERLKTFGLHKGPERHDELDTVTGFDGLGARHCVYIEYPGEGYWHCYFLWKEADEAI